MPGPRPLGSPTKVKPVHCLAEAPEPRVVLSQEAKQSLKEPAFATVALVSPTPPTAVTSEEHSNWKALPAASTILFLSSPGQATGNEVAVASPVPVADPVAEPVAEPVCEDEVVVADTVVLDIVVVVVVVKGAIVKLLDEGA